MLVRFIDAKFGGARSDDLAAAHRDPALLLVLRIAHRFMLIDVVLALPLCARAVRRMWSDS